VIFQKNQFLQVCIEDNTMLGHGVAKVDGAIIFVQNAVKGDKAEIRIIKCAKTYYVARIECLLEASEHRTDISCPHFLRCGGCSFQHIDYQLEKEIKRQYVEQCLKKCGLNEIDVLPVLSTENLVGYRNKAQFPLVNLPTGEVAFGFYSPKTHHVCSVEHCKIQDPSFSCIAKFVCQYLTENKIPAYDEDFDTGLVRHVYLRRATKTGEIMLCLVLKANSFPNQKDFIDHIRLAFPEIVSIVFNINSEKTNVILGKETNIIWGKEKITDILCNQTLLLSPLSFYQVNHDAAELLYETAFQMASVSDYDLILDLYCGIGSIAISASQYTSENIPLVGVEIIEDAIRDARLNAKENKLTNASFFCGDAKNAMEIVGTIGAKKPLVIVDPPRKGLFGKLIDELVMQKFDKILYISCAPDTLARDLSLFQKRGYRISSVQPVDLFPRTSHVETVALLSRQIDLHKMKLNSAPFEMIKSGEKTIELRLYDEKRQKIKVGDKILFTDNATGETLNATVVKLHRFNSFEELYKSLPLLKCGYTEENVDNAKPSDMEQYYPLEEQKKYGVIGIELCRPKQITDECVVCLSREKADDFIRISVHTKDLKTGDNV